MAKTKQFHQSTGRQIKVDGDAKQTEKLKMAILAKRGITSSDANIIATGTPAYVFSTRTSIDEFKNNYAIPKSKAAIQSLQKETAQFARIDSVIPALEEMEAEKATKVLEQMTGIEVGSNPRQQLLDLFNKPQQMNPQNFDVEGLLYYLFQDEINSLDAKSINDANVKFLKNVKNRQKKIGSSAKEINELVKKITQTTFTNQLDAPEIAPVYEKFRKLLQNRDSIKDLNLISLVKTYKGTLQEMIDAAYILETFSTMNVKVNLVGAVKAALEKGDGLQSGSRMQGNSTSLTQSDIEVLIGNEKLGISVKATVDTGTGANKGKSLKYSGTETIKPAARTVSDALFGLKNKPELKEAVQYALVVYASEFNMDKASANYFIRDQVLRPLAFAETSRSSFIDLMFTAGLQQVDTEGKKFRPVAENYHYILAVNGHYFWHSHLLKSAKEDLLNYNSDLYKSLLVTEDISSMSAISAMSSRLLYQKRKILKKADPKREKSYGDRLSILMQNDVMVDLLKQYSKALNSVSFKVNARAFRLSL